MNTFYCSTEERHYKAINIHSHKHKDDSMTMGAWNPGGLMGSKSVLLCNSYNKKQKWRAPEALVQEVHVLLKNNKVDKKNNKIWEAKLDAFKRDA